MQRDADVPDQPSLVSIIIPNYNGASYLRDCLMSLREQTLQSFEVIVVDNGSTDSSESVTSEVLPSAVWLPLGHNRGFSAAANAGIRVARAERLVLLNNDTQARPTWLERLVAALDEVPEASFAASKLLSLGCPEVIDAAGDGFNLLRGSGYSIGTGRGSEEFDERAWVFGACAAGAIYRRSLLEDIGTFDEEFFMALEDVDVDLRAQVAGHRCLYVPDAVVLHQRRGSTDPTALDVYSRWIRNTIWVSGKNLPLSLLAASALAIAFRILRDVVWVATFGHLPAQRRFRPLPTEPRREIIGHYRAAVWEGVRHLPRKRREVRRLRRLGARQLLKALNGDHVSVSSS